MSLHCSSRAASIGRKAMNIEKRYSVCRFPASAIDGSAKRVSYEKTGTLRNVASADCTQNARSRLSAEDEQRELQPLAQEEPAIEHVAERCECRVRRDTQSADGGDATSGERGHDRGHEADSRFLGSRGSGSTMRRQTKTQVTRAARSSWRAATRRETFGRLSPAVPLRWRRCRSSPSASSPRTRASPPHGRDRRSRP